MSNSPDVADDPVQGAPADEGWVRPAASEERPSRRRTRTVLAALLSVGLLAVLGLYAIGYVLAGDTLPRKATISGVPVGGLEPDAATAKLTEALAPAAERPLEVTVAGETDEVLPDEAGLTIDYAASVDAAGGGRTLDPRQIWRVLTGGAATEAVRRTDDTKLATAAQALAERHDTEPRDAGLEYKGARIDQTRARTGIAVETKGAAAALEAAYRSGTDPVEIPAETREPAITNAELKQVVQDFARPAVADGVRLKAGGAGSIDVTPRMIADSVIFEAADGTLVPRLDATRLRQEADNAVDAVELDEPRDATVRIVDGRPKVIPAVDGTSVSADNLAKAVEPLLTKTGDQRRGTVALTGAQAAFGTAEAKALGVKQVTGKFTTYFPYAEYRNVNIPRAAELINNTLLKPGDTFSLNRIVGERTKANGFAEGLIISSGKFRKELGGGVSQSATTTFNAMFFAGLKDVEHQPHTLFIDRYPPGREATVAWPNLDLKFTNDTKYGVLVQAYAKKASPGSQGSITVKMWSTKTYDEVRSTKLARSNFTTGRELEDNSPDCEPMEPVPGFDVNFSRVFVDDGEVVRRENFSWRYAPTDKVRCTGRG